MRPVDVTFAPAPWQVFLESRKTSDTVCAGRLLALLEGEEDSALEEAFQELQELGLTLSLEDLPPRGASGEAALRLKREEELARTGLEPGKLEPSDPLRLYLEEVAAVELREDAHLLAGKAARGDEAARLALTNEGLSRVVTLACEYTGFGVLLLDLIQEGSLGLWQGVAAYQAGDYEAHRDRWIRLSMAKAVLAQARADGVGQRMRTAMEDYRRQDHQLLSQLGRSPTLGELAEGLHLSEGETASVKKCLDDAMLLAMTANPDRKSVV